MEDIGIYFLSSFTSFLAIMNPIAVTPVFVSVTNGMSEEEKNDIALRSLIYAFLITAAFALLGRIIFDLFGITLPAFKIGGGALLFFIGFHMVQGSSSTVHSAVNDKMDPEERKDHVIGTAVSPLAIPILAGPGTLANVMNLVSQRSGYVHMLVPVITFLILCILTYIAFRSGKEIIKFLGKNFISVITKLMGFLLLVIGVQMAIEGIKTAINNPL